MTPDPHAELDRAIALLIAWLRYRATLERTPR